MSEPFAYPELDQFYPDLSVPEPESWAGLTRTARGYPVPYVCMTPDGGYNLAYPNPARVIDCVRHSFCAICGAPLGYWLHFIGGDHDYESRRFAWPAMHRRCAFGAARLCPHLLLRGAARRDERAAVKGGTAAPASLAPARAGVFVTRAQAIEPPRMWVKAAAFASVVWLDADGDIDT